jgi:hypothetical protein
LNAFSDEAVDELHGLFKQVRARLLRFEFDRDVVDAAGVVTCLAVRAADACKLGQLERDMLDDVSEVSSFFEPSHKAAWSSKTTMMIFDSGK